MYFNYDKILAAENTLSLCHPRGSWLLPGLHWLQGDAIWWTQPVILLFFLTFRHSGFAISTVLVHIYF